MANLRLFCCLVVAFLGTGWGLYGQCSCSGSYYYYDGDEDGYAANWQSADRSSAYTDHIDSGCGQGHSGNVIYTCGSPPRYYTSNSREDCDDNDRSVQRDETWYYDSDGDGVGGSQRQTSCGSPGSGLVTSSGDCNDNDASVQSERTFYQDNDGDGVGIRVTARLLGISPTTLIARKKRIAAEIEEPVLVKGKTYEVDELRTFIKKRKVDLGG